MRRLLLLEDDPDQLEVRRSILETCGYEVRAAASAREALAAAEGCDVAVVDLSPGAEELVAHLPEATRLIVLSGRDAVDPSISARSASVLRKPCSSRLLLETIARIAIALIFALAALSARTFTLSKTGEAVADIEMRAPGTDWSETGHEAAMAKVILDGKPQQEVMLYAGAQSFRYPVFLGRLAAGEHRLEVEGKGVEFLGADFRVDDAEYVRNAPILYARPDTVGRFTDIPLILYCERLIQNRRPMLRYTVIFSNEDAGTSTRALMARWGRTTDVEYVYEGIVESDGLIHRAIIQAKDHKDVEFTGLRDGSHPLLMPVTDNNMVGEADTSIPIRYQIAPVLVDLSKHSREEVMDTHPIAYKVMSQELKREDKLRPWGVVDGEKVSDPRNYLYFELKLAPRESAVGAVVHLKNGSSWYSSTIGRTDLAISIANRHAAESTFGYARTTVELPPGTRGDSIAAIGFACVTPPKVETGNCRVEAVPKVFFLDPEYRPGANVWTMSSPVEIPAGQIWTSPLK